MTANASTLSPEGRSVIKQAREMIRDPQHWTQGVYSRSIDDGRGTARCLMGAIRSSAFRAIGHGVNPDVLDAADFALRLIALDLYGMSLVGVNDRLGHAAVMRLLAVALGEDDPGEES